MFRRKRPLGRRLPPLVEIGTAEFFMILRFYEFMNLRILFLDGNCAARKNYIEVVAGNQISASLLCILSCLIAFSPNKCLNPTKLR